MFHRLSTYSATYKYLLLILWTQGWSWKRADFSKKGSVSFVSKRKQGLLGGSVG